MDKILVGKISVYRTKSLYSVKKLKLFFWPDQLFTTWYLCITSNEKNLITFLFKQTGKIANFWKLLLVRSSSHFSAHYISYLYTEYRFFHYLLFSSFCQPILHKGTNGSSPDSLIVWFPLIPDRKVKWKTSFSLETLHRNKR